jgi:hypothetical protein
MMMLSKKVASMRKTSPEEMRKSARRRRSQRCANLVKKISNSSRKILARTSSVERGFKKSLRKRELN